MSILGTLDNDTVLQILSIVHHTHSHLERTNRIDTDILLAPRDASSVTDSTTSYLPEALCPRTALSLSYALSHFRQAKASAHSETAKPCVE